MRGPRCISRSRSKDAPMWLLGFSGRGALGQGRRLRRRPAGAEVTAVPTKLLLRFLGRFLGGGATFGRSAPGVRKPFPRRTREFFGAWFRGELATKGRKPPASYNRPAALAETTGNASAPGWNFLHEKSGGLFFGCL